MATIGTLAAAIKLDTSGFTKGAILTKKEVRDVAKVFRETRTPAEAMANKLSDLEKLYRKGAIDANTYARATKKVKDATKEAGGGVDLMALAVSRLPSSLTSVTGAIAAVTTAVTGAAVAIKLFAIDTVSALDALGDAGDRIGATTASMQTLAYAAQLNGTTIEAITPSLSKLTVLLGKATGGDVGAAAALKAIGLSAKQLVGLPIDRQLEMIGVGLSKLPTIGERAAAAVKIFGKAGSALVPVLADGGVAIAGARDELTKLGALLSDDQAAAVDQADKAWTRFSVTFKSTFTPAVVSCLEPFTAFLGLLGDALPLITEVGKGLAGTLTGGITSLLGAVAPGAAGLLSGAAAVSAAGNGRKAIGGRGDRGLTQAIDSLPEEIESAAATAASSTATKATEAAARAVLKPDLARSAQSANGDAALFAGPVNRAQSAANFRGPAQLAGSAIKGSQEAFQAEQRGKGSPLIQVAEKQVVVMERNREAAESMLKELRKLNATAETVS